jgi:hypothetical protein
LLLTTPTINALEKDLHAKILAPNEDPKGTKRGHKKSKLNSKNKMFFIPLSKAFDCPSK